MIGEFILNILFTIVTGIFSLFPMDISWDVGSGAMAPFMNIVSSVCYFLPMGTISAIVSLIVAMGIFRAVIRLVITIWDLLPVA